MKAKILLSDNSLWGLINFRGALIDQLKKIGYEVVVVAPTDNALIAENKIDFTYEQIKLDRSSYNILADLRYLISLYKLIKQHRPSVLICYTIKPNIFGSLISKLLNVKCICVVTGLGYIFQKNSFLKSLLQRLYVSALENSFFNFFLNEDNLQRLKDRGYEGQNYKVLPGGEGIDTSSITPGVPPSNDSITFIMVARVLYDKGYSEYVHAARENPDAKFILIGALDSNPQAVPSKIVSSEQSIVYLGFLSKKETLAQMNNADCIVLPSYHEGMSVTLMEACALAKPIICSNIPGCKEMLIQDVNGYGVQPRSKESLSAACRKFMQLTRSERYSMGASSRTLAKEKLDVSLTIKEYLKVL